MRQQKKNKHRGKFGRLLRSHRERLGISGNDFARRIPIDQALLSRIERGVNAAPHLIYVRRMADELGLLPDSPEFVELVEAASKERVGTQGRPRLLAVLEAGPQGVPVVRTTGIISPELHGLPDLAQPIVDVSDEAARTPTSDLLQPIVLDLGLGGLVTTGFLAEGEIRPIDVTLPNGHIYTITISRKS